MKRCADVRQALSDYLEGRFHPTTEDAVARHLENCAACSNALVAQVESARQGEFASVREWLDERRSSVPDRLRPSLFQRLKRPTAVAAALLICVLGVWLVRLTTTEESQSPRENTVAKNATKDQSASRPTPSESPESVLMAMAKNPDEVATYEVTEHQPNTPDRGFLVHLQKDDRRLVHEKSNASSRPLGGRSGAVLWRFDEAQKALRVSPKESFLALERQRPPLPVELARWAREGQLTDMRFETIAGRRCVTAKREKTTTGAAGNAVFSILAETGRVLWLTETFGDGERIEWAFKKTTDALPAKTFLPAHWADDQVQVDVDWFGFEASGVSVNELVDGLTMSDGFFGQLLVVGDDNDKRPLADRIVDALTADGPLAKWISGDQKDELREVIERSLSSLPIFKNGWPATQPIRFDAMPPGLRKAIDGKILDEAQTLWGLVKAIEKATGVKIDVRLADRRLENIRLLAPTPNAFTLLMAVALIYGGEVKVVGDGVVIE